MKRLVEFGLEQGGSILVEVDEPAADGPVMRGGGLGRPALVGHVSGIFEGNTSLLYQEAAEPAAAHDGAIGGGLACP